ncbi:hypothetical protein [Roseibium sp. MB-4]
MTAIYRFFNPLTGSHYFASGDAERAAIAAQNPTWLNEGKAFDAITTAATGLVGVERWFNPESGRYLFTADDFEQSVLPTTGWVKQLDAAWYVSRGESAELGYTSGVFRLFVPALNGHVYSSNQTEINILTTTLNATNEGQAYFISPTGGEPVVNTIVLTTNTDTPDAASPSQDTSGTTGDDAYTGRYDPTGNATTYSNADILSGNTGTDSMTVLVTSTDGNTVDSVSTGVENFFVTNQSTSANAFIWNFQNIQGETTVTDLSSTGTGGSVSRFINVDSGATAAMTTTLGLMQVHFSGTRTGTTDAFTLELNGAGSTTQAATFSTTDASGNTDSSFEVANITSSTAESNVSLGNGGMTLTTVNISGDAALTLAENQNFAGLTTVNASTFTGALNIDASGSTQTGFSFTGGSANDRVLLANNTVSSATTLNGNGGTDTLATTNINTLTASTVNSATNFEVLEDIGGARSFTASNFTSINSFLFSTAATTNRATMSGIESSDSIAISADITYGGDEGLRLTGNAAGTTANLELRATSATNGEVAITANNNNNDVSAIGLETNVSTLNLSSTLESGTQTNANLIKGTSTTDNSYGIENTNVANVNISGSHALTINAEAGTSLANGQQVYGFSSGVNADASSFTGVLRIAGSASADTIQGGSGADIIYGLGGADVLTGNGGADQFRHAHYNNSVDRITDFTVGTDKIGLNQIDFGNTTATQAGATLSTADYITNVSSITTIGGGAANTVIELQTSQSTSDMTNNTGSAVAAYVLVHNSTTGRGELWYDTDWSTTANRDQLYTFDTVTSLAGIQAFSNTDFVEYSF